MSLYDVATQPQAIYEAGLQDAVTILNKGPWTVYLDSDSSVGAQSYALPPTGTIVWDAGRPLWAVAPGGEAFTVTGDPNYTPSRLVLTRNAYQGTAPRAATVDRLYKRQGVSVPGGFFSIPTIETASYNTLFIQFNSAEAGGPFPSIDKYFDVQINWTDEQGRIIGVDDYISPATSTANLELGVILTTPIRGARADLSFYYDETSVPAGTRFSFEVYATSRALRDRQDWMLFPTGGPFNPGAAVNATCFAALAEQINKTGYYACTNWFDVIADDIFLNGIGNDIQVTIRVTGDVTTQGRVLIQSFYDPAAIFADIVIPVSAFSQTVVTQLYVPVSTPVIINATPAPVGPDQITVAIVWKDYNG